MIGTKGNTENERDKYTSKNGTAAGTVFANNQLPAG